MYEDDEARLAKLIAECERLRKRMHELDAQAEIVDKRPVEIEEQLPNDYPGDRPQDRLPRH